MEHDSVHLYLVKKHECGDSKGLYNRICDIFVSSSIDEAKKFVNKKIYQLNQDWAVHNDLKFCQWKTDIDTDLTLICNPSIGVTFSITGFDTEKEYEDL